MAKQLVLLTSKFPCARGEEFIESEIPYLAAAFEKIVVVPTYLQGDVTQTRALPDNCELVIPAPANDRRIRSLAERVREALRSPMMGRNLVRPQGFPIDLRFAVKTLASYDRVKAALEDAGVDREVPTVLYGYWLFRPAALAVMLRNGHFDGSAKAVSRAHRFDVYAERGVLGHLPSRRFLVSSLDRIFPVSTSAANVIGKIRGASREKIEVARLGVEGPPSVPERTLSHPVHFVSCSSLPPLKRVTEMVKAFGILLKSGETRFRWTHIGDSGAESLNGLRAMIREEGLEAHAEAIGRLDNPAVLEFFERPDVHFLVNFSSSEGVPVTIMEAAARGVPAIATDVGGTGELVQPGRNGFLLDAAGDTGELASVLGRVIGMDACQYTKLANGARASWAEMSDAGDQYPRFARRLREIGVGIAN